MTGAVTLRPVDPSRNMARFYRLDVQPDLFGGYRFVREGGRIGRGATVRVRHFPSEAEARAALERQRQAKERLGYCPQWEERSLSGQATSRATDSA